ncbi:MAG: TetR/AcrR family transcriptional regulator [Alphaproteobacteria bacterium]|nr:MAG: TetR/AcrR family transcriptional regulator [Alphaproteobacteria bacterium]
MSACPVPGGGSDRAPDLGAEPKLRADAQRNRDSLLAAARTAFTETGPDVCLEEIARQAGVGIGTLYRHFPNREALVAAVYRREMEQLAAEADRLLADHTPAEALRRWLRLSLGYVANKKMIASALGTAADMAALSASTGTLVPDALARLVAAAVASGDIRADVSADDILKIMKGFYQGNTEPGWADQTLRILDIFMDGLTARAAPPQAG